MDGKMSQAIEASKTSSPPLGVDQKPGEYQFQESPLKPKTSGELSFCLAMELAAGCAANSSVALRHWDAVHRIAAEARSALNYALSDEESAHFPGRAV
jgi:hypothetical protein